MSYLKKKEKIILVVIIGIVAIGIYCYKETKEGNLIQTKEENLEILQEETQSQDKAEETIKIHVSGAVKEEGIIELEQGSRVADAIEKAGGLEENACMEEINLAYLLEDGMKIYIPTIEEQKQIEENKNDEYITKSSGTSINGKSTDEESTKININTSTQTELETLPGIGPTTALKIIQYRKEQGNFKSIEEIKEVSGIGESKFSQIKELITI